MHCERTNNTRFLFPQLFDSKVFQTIPDNAGMGSFPEVRPRDARAQRTRDFGGPVLRGVLYSAVTRYQRTVVSKSENSRIVESRCRVYPIHSLIPIPQNHLHRRQILSIRPSRSDCRSSDHSLPNTVSRLAEHHPAPHTKRSGDHRRCFSKRSPMPRCGFPVDVGGS